MEMFTISRSVRGSDTCFTFIPHTNATYNVRHVKADIRARKIVYTVAINRTIFAGRETRKITITSFFTNNADGNDFPYNSREFADELHISTNESYLFRVSGATTRIIRLEPPYDTMCKRGANPEKCVDERTNHCLETKLGVHYWGNYITNETSNFTVASDDVRHLPVADACVNEAKVACLKTPACESSSTKTLVKTNGIESGVVLAATVPHDYDNIITHSIAMTTEDYIMSMLSFAGAAFGFSIVGLGALFGANCTTLLVFLRLVPRTPNQVGPARDVEAGVAGPNRVMSAPATNTRLHRSGTTGVSEASLVTVE
jgi:hypothetical protein